MWNYLSARYLVEVRSGEKSYCGDWRAPDSGIVLYKVTTILGHDSVDKITLANRYMDESTLSTEGQSYLDPLSFFNFSYVPTATANRADGYYQTVSVTPYSPLNLVGTMLSQLLPDTSQPMINSNGTAAPDLDLHAYTLDGKHIGMNYTTGLYENQIPGAIASGDLAGSDEWIFVPTGTQVTYDVSSHDVGEFLKVNPELTTQFQSLTFNVTNLGFDSNGSSYNISNQTYSIPPDSVIEINAPNGSTPSPTQAPNSTPTPAPMSTTTPTPNPSQLSTSSPSPPPAVPEFPSWIVLPALLIIILPVAIAIKRKSIH